MNNFKIVPCDGDQITYETKNDAGEKIYYAFVPFNNSCKDIFLYRCAQPFIENGFKYYEPSNTVLLSDHIMIETCKGDSKLEIKVNEEIEKHIFLNGY